MQRPFPPDMGRHRASWALPTKFFAWSPIFTVWYISFSGMICRQLFSPDHFQKLFPTYLFQDKKNPTKSSFSSLFVTCSGICKDHHQADNSSCRGKVKNIQSINFLLICVSEKTWRQHCTTPTNISCNPMFM